MQIKGKKILVVGLGATGVAAAKFLAERGGIVSVTDSKDKKALFPEVKALKGYNINYFLGGHDEKVFLNQNLIVVSPGVPIQIEPIVKSIKAGIKVISEIELAYRFLKKPFIIGITGTNGKTTTTTLIGEFLKKSGFKTFVGGNIGTPLIEASSNDFERYVVEISSFQLEALDKFKTEIGVLLNITEDHLDRYALFKDYADAKFNLFKNNLPSAISVLNRDDEIVMDFEKGLKNKKLYFSQKKFKGSGAYVYGDFIILLVNNIKEKFPLNEIKIKGAHNRENIMAALIAGKYAGAKPEVMRKVLNEFTGLPHRMEYVRNINGIEFYNDSKGTNVGSVEKSLLSFNKNIILIMGGKDKGGSYKPLEELVKNKVKKLILIGEAKKRIYDSLGNITNTEMAVSLNEAVKKSYISANNGDVVLFSPGCSSFDMFKDYKERGNTFKKLVTELKDDKK